MVELYLKPGYNDILPLNGHFARKYKMSLKGSTKKGYNEKIQAMELYDFSTSIPISPLGDWRTLEILRNHRDGFSKKGYSKPVKIKKLWIYQTTRGVQVVFTMNCPASFYIEKY